jgi:hypothetical protein
MPLSLCVIKLVIQALKPTTNDEYCLGLIKVSLGFALTKTHTKTNKVFSHNYLKFILKPSLGDGLSGNQTLDGKTNGKFVNLGVQNSE